MLRYVVPAIWALLATLCGQTAAAAIDAKISFETEIPKAFVCGENSAAELSGLHYKDGSRSLRWSWSAPSTLRFNDFGQLMRSLRVKGAGVMLWIYNPRAVDADMR
ncbi:chondroitinase family protein, partial [Alistipes shahii]